MIAKPKEKPVVLGVLNRTCLLVNLTSKVLSLASSLCGLVLCGSFERQQNGFPQVFNRVFNNGMKWG